MVTSSSLVYLIGLPLFGATFLLLMGRKADKWGHLLATAMSAGSFVLGVAHFLAMTNRASEERALTQTLFSWIKNSFFSKNAC